MSKIKLCGLSRNCDIDYVNEALPDYIGFVFYEKSIRYVTPGKAYDLKCRLSDKIKAVGLFVDASQEDIVSLADKGIIDMIQLHGCEDAEFINRLKDKISVPIMKAVRVKDRRDVEKASEINADYLLFDAYCRNMAGGTGKMFNWDLLKNTTINKPFFLAGGLNRENIETAVKTVNPYAVDISSGIETNGVKDRDKIIEIVRRVRNV